MNVLRMSPEELHAALEFITYVDIREFGIPIEVIRRSGCYRNCDDLERRYQQDLIDNPRPAQAAA